ncbi:MAG: FkbM family methyltransferase [Prevotellaceae bacterium]|jgi:hypothetical protein|nr:FkbM family methyltransferase [Prevotellaceae bacterium]
MNDKKAFLLVDRLNKLLVKQAVLTKSTSRESILSLIEKLHPFESEKQLIRLGPNSDGGYLVPDDLEGIAACFSPGVSSISGFELDCAKRGMAIYMADKSVDKPELDIPAGQYHFLKKFIGCVNNDDYITMDEWVNTSSVLSDSDLLLQMDIEGGEYTAIINTSDSLMKRFRIMVIEFHYFKDLWNKRFFNLVENTFDKILQTHYCVHIHPNNYFGIDRKMGVEIPRLAEFTFLRRRGEERRGEERRGEERRGEERRGEERREPSLYAKKFPHKFDFDNVAGKTIILPKQWYK